MKELQLIGTVFISLGFFFMAASFVVKFISNKQTRTKR